MVNRTIKINYNIGKNLIISAILMMILMLFSASAFAVTTNIQETYIVVDTLNGTTINQNGNNVIDDSDIGSTVQAYDSDLADLADGTLSKSKVEDSTNWDAAYGWGNHASYGYITVAVSTLQNYYLKSETYNKSEVYNKTEIDTQGEMETIWGVTLATDSELAGQDECSEITGCIEGAYNSESNLTTLLDDNYLSLSGGTLTSDLNLNGNALTNTSTLWETSQNGLVLDMSFSKESISGTTVMDSSPYQNDGTNSGATHNDNCNDLGFCDWMEFDGEDDYIIVDDEPSNEWGKTICNNGCTFSMWSKRESLSTQNVMIGRTDSTSNDRFFILEIDASNFPQIIYYSAKRFEYSKK